MSSKTSLTKGNWMCPDESCGNMNFPKRDKCNRCGTKKKDAAKVGIEIGKVIAEKSKGLFSADDWMCKSCGNINWARRTACNICNTSKVNTQGQRTGYGGGFYEREEEVEYVNRNYSDDEYDEFGMKKKKYRGHTQNAENEKNDEESEEKDCEVDKKEVNEDVDEEEEDENDEPEEDSDGGDLSKYDLWGDDDNATPSAKPLDDKKKISQSSNSSISSSSSGSSSDSSEDSDSSSSSSSAPRKTADGDKGDTRKQKTKKIERSRSRSPVARKDKKH